MRRVGRLRRAAAAALCALLVASTALDPVLRAAAMEPAAEPVLAAAVADLQVGPDEGRAYSLRLLVKTGVENIRAEDAVLGEHGGVYLLGFADEGSLAEAEAHYAQAAAWCERDIPMGASEGEAPEGDPAPVGADDNALALLDDAEAEPVDASVGKPLVALIDTGAPADAAVVGAVSVIGDDATDVHGHATAVLAAMKGEDPAVQVLSIKALDDEGAGSASSVYAAVEYAIGAGAGIINLSLAGRASEGNAAIAEAVTDALREGIFVVVAAGNGGYDASYFTPANVPGVITVGACDEDGAPLASSNRGETVDYYAAADSTSLAAARVSGWLSAHVPADDWQEQLVGTDWVYADAGFEGGEPTDPAPDGVQASTVYTHSLSGGTGGGGPIYYNSSNIKNGASKGWYLDSGLTRQMTTSSNAVPVPSNGDYVFQGYWGSGGTHAINYQGYLYSSTAAVANSKALTARWGLIILNDYYGSGGQGYIYPLYNDGVYASYSSATHTFSNRMYNGYGGTVTLPTRPGYRFDGYYYSTNYNGSNGTEYIDRYGRLTSSGYSSMGDSSNSSWANGSHTLYARWTEAPWTITLDKQGGSGGTDQLYTANGRGSLSGIFFDIDGTNKYSSSNRVGTPSKSYQTFMGYYDSPYHGGTQRITSSGTTNNFTQSTFNNNTTLYAAWQGVRININKQSGTGGDSSDFFEMYGEKFSTNQYGSASSYTRVNPPSRTNYMFMGYYTGQNGSGTQVTDQSGNIICSNKTFTSTATIYAYWLPEHYIITLDPQGADSGQEGTPLVYEVYKDAVYKSIPFTSPVTQTGNPITIPKRAGYVFQGYFTDTQTSYASTRGTQLIKPDGTLTTHFYATRFRANTRIYAQWKVAPHTVTLDKQGGTGGTDQVYEMKSVGVALDWDMTRLISRTGYGKNNPVSVPTKPYQTFKGYYVEQFGRGHRLLTEKGFHTDYFNGNQYTSDATAYAYWEGFKIKLDRQKGTGGPAQIYSYYNEKYTSDDHGSATIFSITPPHRSHYTFMGYYTGTNGGGTQVIDRDGTIVAPTTQFKSDDTVYAYWAPENYVITLDPNGADNAASLAPQIWELYGTGIYSDDQFTNVMTTSVNPVPLPVKAGQIFRGYYTSRTGGSQRIDTDGYITSGFKSTTYTKDATLYARWADPPYTITLDHQGATGGTPAVYELYGTGVFIEPSCKNSQWMITGSKNPVTIPTPAAPPSTPNRVFGGYWTEPGGKGQRLINEQGYRSNFPNTLFDHDATIYAFWRGYTITLDDQGGTGGSKQVYEYYGTGLYSDIQGAVDMASANVPRRSGYDFNGYYTGKGGTGVQLIDADGAFIDPFTTYTYFTGDATIYAYWTPKKYTITLDNQGADIQPGSSEVYESYNVGVYLDSALANVMTTTINPIALPEKNHHNFGGYYTRESGSGTQRIDANGYKTNSFGRKSYSDDDTLYASWLPLTITLDDQGGTGGSGAIYEDWGNGIYRKQGLTEQMTTTQRPVQVPTMLYREFKGYYTKPDGAGDLIIDGTGHLASGVNAYWFDDDATIYACWEFKLKLPITGGEGTNTTVLWLAALGVVLGGACVLGRRYLAEAAAANRPGKHSRQPIERHARR